MRVVVWIVVALWVPAAALGQGISGAYLAARQAVIDGDHRAAADYFEQALRADPGNLSLISNAVLANAALGDWDSALEIAALLPDTAENRQLVDIVEQVDRIARGDRVGALAAIEELRGAGPFIDELSRAWLLFGEGDMSAASETLEELAASGPLADIARYHLALLRAAAGDFERADEILSGTTYGPIPASARSIQAHAQILVQLDRTDAAIDLLDTTIAIAPDPAILRLRETIAGDPDRAYGFVVTPEDGVAEVFYTVAR
ncbi:MAG: tetratricopeptide repeat protein, partial [Pseudomonadota bacterium]